MPGAAVENLAVREQMPGTAPDLLEAYGDQQITLFGVTGTPEDLIKMCPVPHGEMTLEAKNMFLVTALNESEVAVKEEHMPYIKEVLESRGMEVKVTVQQEEKIPESLPPAQNLQPKEFEQKNKLLVKSNNVASNEQTPKITLENEIKQPPVTDSIIKPKRSFDIYQSDVLQQNHNETGREETVHELDAWLRRMHEEYSEYTVKNQANTELAASKNKVHHEANTKSEVAESIVDIPVGKASVGAEIAPDKPPTKRATIIESDSAVIEEQSFTEQVRDEVAEFGALITEVQEELADGSMELAADTDTETEINGVIIDENAAKEILKPITEVIPDVKTWLEELRMVPGDEGAEILADEPDVTAETTNEPYVPKYKDVFIQQIEELAVEEPKKAEQATELLREVQELAVYIAKVYEETGEANIEQNTAKEIEVVEQKLQEACKHLLDTLGLEYDEETIDNMVKAIIVAEQHKLQEENQVTVELNEESTDEGTHERKKFSLQNITNFAHNAPALLIALGRFALTSEQETPA